MSEPQRDAQEFWDEFYDGDDRIWSGGVNGQLAQIAADLEPGRALDLGCGEGADAIWLAEKGWRVLAVDVSANALERARAAARQRDVLSRIRFERHDLSDSFPDGRFDLVSAQFLHSPARLDRETVLRRAADAVAVGGRLLIVDHGAPPPGADAHDHHFATVEEVLAGLRLDDAQWRLLRAERVERDAVGRDGTNMRWTDNVILLRRTPNGVDQAAS
ncbi:SAM-dependent methyltransferase [Mycolicibacter senuensis]|uniref:Methyltransferase domain-containing protein n=1 Tax=Mycolicibacter senuensis TaxID=386913 RepID=A0A7I9XJK9_9MYCO|nr:class I SAM-dependent methyltransferase [Mycolicibacter senuensis]ORW68646.1 SAM-dependent methyltransferase [Mycolicibacter senuensis]GFG69898.1 hypothetical protein MSEN_16180 [Mycolicibacter senuensis]